MSKMEADRVTICGTKQSRDEAMKEEEGEHEQETRRRHEKKAQPS